MEAARPLRDAQLEQHDQHAVRRDQQAVGGRGKAERRHLQREGRAHLEIDDCNAEGCDQKDDVRPVACRYAQRFAGSLAFHVRPQTLRQREESDEAVDDRGGGVADEQQREGVVRQEAGRGGTGGESEIHRESIEPEGSDAMLVADEITDQRVAGRAVELG